MNKIAIMQPYFFPYIGYYQLIKSVDTFYVFDDVAFIKRGWINKNKIIVNQTEYSFTIPLKNASHNRNISEHFISDEFDKWRNDFYKTIHHSYKKYKNYDEVMKIIEESLQYNNIVDITENSLKSVSFYLDIETKFKRTSTLSNTKYSKAERLISICNQVNSNIYVNSIGGQELYTKDYFADNGISLFFLKCNDPYGYVSIIDLLMKHGKETKNLINNYELI